MKRYRVSVCKGPDCRRNGSDAVFRQAAEELKQAGLVRTCELYRGGCYGLCHLGANVVIRVDTGAPRDPLAREDFQLMGWEGETHYGAMTPEKITRVVREHLAADRVVEDLATDGEPPPADEPGQT